MSCMQTFKPEVKRDRFIFKHIKPGVTGVAGVTI